MTRTGSLDKHAPGPQPSASSSTVFRGDSPNLAAAAVATAVPPPTAPNRDPQLSRRSPPAVLPAQRLKLQARLQPRGVLELSVLLPQPDARAAASFPALLMSHRLARGTFGKFHVGVDATGAAFAVKQVRFEARAEVDSAKQKQGHLHYTAVEAFHREATFLHLHSTALSLRGLYATDDFCGFLVTELMAGDLDSCMTFCRRHLMPSPQQGQQERGEDARHLVDRLAIAARVLLDVGLEMSRLLAAGITHQDVKAKNILVSEAPHRIVLADYGFASRLAADGSAERTRLGTFAYANPEVVQGMGHRPCGDVWSLGATLVEVLTGRILFDGDAEDPSQHRADLDGGGTTLRLHEKYRSWHCALDTVDECVDDEFPAHARSEGPFFVHLSATYHAMRPFRHLRAFIVQGMLHPYPSLRPSFARATAFAADLLSGSDLLGKSPAPAASWAVRAGRHSSHWP